MNRLVIKRRVIMPLWACLLPLMSLFVTAVTHAEATTTANIQGQGTFHLPAPCNCQVDVQFEVHAQGDPGLLSGRGYNHATTGVTNIWSVTGSTDGTVVSLSGSVVDSTVPYLITTPVAVTANEASGEITFTLGPFAGGPFQGQTYAIPASGTVVINNP